MVQRPTPTRLARAIAPANYWRDSRMVRIEKAYMGDGATPTYNGGATV